MVHNKKHIRADIMLFVFFFVASGLVSVYLGQDRNWDLRNYHFYNPYAFLNDRLTYDIAPAQLQSFHNPLLDIPFYLMMTHLRPIVYGFLVGGLQGINIWLVFKITYTILSDLSDTSRRLLSLAAGITGYYSAANLSEIGTTFHDNVTSLFVLGALLLTVMSLQVSWTQSVLLSRKCLTASGFLLGLATGLKLVVAVYALAFLSSLMLIGSTWRDRIKNVAISGVSIFLGAAISIGYWMRVLWENFQSPLFPYYNKVFKSPYFDPVNFFDDRFFPRDKYQILFYPFHFLKDSTLVSEAGFRDIRFALCYLLLMLFFFMVFYKRVARTYGKQELVQDMKNPVQIRNISIFFLAFFVLSYVLWQYSFSIYRYLIPLELIAPIFILLIMRYIFPFKKIFVCASLGLFALIVVTMSPMNWGRVPWAASYFDVRIPPLDNLAQSTVIMADYEPLSYVIPYFPRSTRFVSVNNNFTRPSSRDLLQSKIADILRNSPHLYLLCKGQSREDYDSILKSYNLKMDKQKSKILYTRFDDDLSLIPVVHLK